MFYPFPTTFASASLTGRTGTTDMTEETRELDMWDFDGRGMYLSRELQNELGPSYRVHYFFTFAGGRDKWMPLVEDAPCEGWTAS